MVKNELTSEEKFFEKAVVTEKFVKKYKTVMIGSVVAVVVIVAGTLFYDATQANRVADANNLTQEMKSSTENTAALARLETLSPALHDVWLYSKAISENNVEALRELQDSKVPLIGDLASYELAQTAQELKVLEAYAQKQNALYRDLAVVQSAIILMSEDKIDAAHTKLSMISVSSPLAKVSSALMHYGVK